MMYRTTVIFLVVLISSGATLGICATPNREIDGTPPVDAVHKAAISGDLGALQRLLQADPTLTAARTNDGKIPLHFAAYFGHM